jgi:hypothetical protein
VAVAAVSAVTVGGVVVTDIRSRMHPEEVEEVPVGTSYWALMANSFEMAEQEAQRQDHSQVCVLAMRGSRCFESAEKELHHMAVVDMYSVVL